MGSIVFGHVAWSRVDAIGIKASQLREAFQQPTFTLLHCPLDLCSLNSPCSLVALLPSLLCSSSPLRLPRPRIMLLNPRPVLLQVSHTHSVEPWKLILHAAHSRWTMQRWQSAVLQHRPAGQYRCLCYQVWLLTWICFSRPLLTRPLGSWQL